MIRTVPAYNITFVFDFDPTGSGGVGAPQWAFGVNVSDNSFWFHTGVGPTQWVKIGSGSGGGGGGPTVLGWSYTVTGAEPDPSEFVVPIPVPFPDADYVVAVTCQGVEGIAVFDVPTSSKTASSFLLVATGALTAGDVVSFVAVSTAPLFALAVGSGALVGAPARGVTSDADTSDEAGVRVVAV